MNDLLTVTDIVNEYHVARKTVQRWVKAEKIIPIQTLSGKTGAHLFTRHEVDRAFSGHKKSREEKAVAAVSA